MNRGFIKLWRKSLDSQMLTNPELWRFWCYCLMKAGHKPTKVTVGFQEIQLEPGQFLFGRKQAAKELKTTERKIRTGLASVKKSKKVTIKTTNKFSIISIVNWNTYQGEHEQNVQQNDQQVTSKRPQTRIIKNVKNREEEKLIAQSCASDSSEQPASDPVLFIPLIPRDGEFPIYQQHIDEWQAVFPGVDVLAELRKCRLWNQDNPSRRKTARGIRNHIRQWFDKAQNGTRASSSTKAAVEPAYYEELN